MNWIDIVILCILVIFVGIGFYKGFIFSILSLFSGFINFLIALFLTRPVTNLFNSWFGLEASLTSTFEKKLLGMGEGFSTNLVGMGSADLNSFVSSTIKSSNLPFKNMINSMVKLNPEVISSKGTLTLTDILSKSFGSFFAIIISFITIFVLIWLVLFLISFITKKLRQNDSIRTVDRVMGVLFGIVKAGITISFVFAFLSFFNENGVLSSVFDYIKASTIGNWWYSNINTLVDKYLNFKTIVSVIKSFA